MANLKWIPLVNKYNSKTELSCVHIKRHKPLASITFIKIAIIYGISNLESNFRVLAKKNPAWTLLFWAVHIWGVCDYWNYKGIFVSFNSIAKN